MHFLKKVFVALTTNQFTWLWNQNPPKNMQMDEIHCSNAKIVSFIHFWHHICAHISNSTQTAENTMTLHKNDIQTPEPGSHDIQKERMDELWSNYGRTMVELGSN